MQTLLSRLAKTEQNENRLFTGGLFMYLIIWHVIFIFGDFHNVVNKIGEKCEKPGIEYAD